MNQWQYETIRKCIVAGCPAAATELVGAFDQLVLKVAEVDKQEKEKES